MLLSRRGLGSRDSSSEVSWRKEERRDRLLWWTDPVVLWCGCEWGGGGGGSGECRGFALEMNDVCIRMSLKLVLVGLELGLGILGGWPKLSECDGVRLWLSGWCWDLLISVPEDEEFMLREMGEVEYLPYFQLIKTKSHTYTNPIHTHQQNPGLHPTH